MMAEMMMKWETRTVKTMMAKMRRTMRKKSHPRRRWLWGRSPHPCTLEPEQAQAGTQVGEAVRCSEAARVAPEEARAADDLEPSG
jgi:hypothetical protein